MQYLNKPFWQTSNVKKGWNDSERQKTCKTEERQNDNSRPKKITRIICHNFFCSHRRRFSAAMWLKCVSSYSISWYLLSVNWHNHTPTHNIYGHWFLSERTMRININENLIPFLCQFLQAQRTKKAKMKSRKLSNDTIERADARKENQIFLWPRWPRNEQITKLESDRFARLHNCGLKSEARSSNSISKISNTKRKKAKKSWSRSSEASRFYSRRKINWWMSVMWKKISWLNATG